MPEEAMAAELCLQQAGVPKPLCPRGGSGSSLAAVVSPFFESGKFSSYRRIEM